MSRKKESSGFSARIERVRERLGFSSKAAFAAALGMQSDAYRNWSLADASPIGAALKRALKALRSADGRGLSERPQLLDWLFDGEDAPPAWLEDAALDPYGTTPEGPPAEPTRPAMPHEAATKLRDARSLLRAEVARSGARVEGGILRALADLDDGFRLLPGLDVEDPEAQRPRTTMAA